MTQAKVNKTPIRKKKYSDGKLMSRRDRISVYLMILPVVVPFVLFCVYPVFYLLRLSFYSYDGMTEMEWVGFANYIRLFQDKTWWTPVFNTVQLGVLIPLSQIPLSLILACILNMGIKGSSIFRTFIFLPNITSTAIMGVVFWFIFSSYNGVVNGILMNLNLISKPIEWLSGELTAKTVIVIFSTWAGTGFYMVLFLAGLQKISKDVYESAALDGANSVQTFFKITVPLLGPMFQIVTLLSILNAMKLFDTVKVLTNGGPGNKTEVMTMFIYRYFFEPAGGSMQQGYASSASIFSLFVMGLIAIIYAMLSFGGNRHGRKG